MKTQYEINRMHGVIEKVFESIVDEVIRFKNLATEYIDEINEINDENQKLKVIIEDHKIRIEYLEEQLKEKEE
jgi:cell shape-determining protein MreC